MSKNPSSAVKKISVEEFRNLSFPPDDFPISAKSKFISRTWDFRDPSVVRLNSVNDSKLIIEWDLYLEPPQAGDKGHRRAHLLPGVIEELRLFGFFYYLAPQQLKTRGKAVEKTKPQTVVSLARTLALFFSDVDNARRARFQALNLPSPEKIQSLAEVTLEDLKSAISISERRDGENLRKGLRFLTSPLFLGRFNGSGVQWTESEVSDLDYKYPNARVDLKRTMPDELFRLLSNSACEDVVAFLRLLDLNPKDKSNPNAWPARFTMHGFSGNEIFEDYVAIRERDQASSRALGHKTSSSNDLREIFIISYGISPSDFLDYLRRIQRAALVVIGFYASGHYADLATFKIDSIDIRHGIPAILGTEVKHKALNSPEGEDLWPAIPVVEDAVECFKQLYKLTNNPHLLGSLDYSSKPAPFTNTGLNNALTNYLREIDVEGDWAGWSLSSNQLRHSITHQLGRIDMGMVYISNHLRHLHSAYAALPAEVTFAYGNLGQQRMARAVASVTVNYDIARALYHPDAPVSGGGGEEFLVRRKMYFAGRMAAGATEEQILSSLAAAGMPFVSVGTGYCGGVKDEQLKDGSKAPPCIGDLQCNPGDCGQSIITIVHKPLWEKIVAKNKELATDPRLAHAKENYEMAIETGERVLRDLQG